MPRKLAPVRYRLTTEAEVLPILAARRGEPLIFDTETDGLLVRDGQHQAQYLGLVYAQEPDECAVLRAPFSDALLRALAASALVGHNARFDCHALGLDLTQAAPWDTMVRIYGFNTASFKSLDDVAPRLGYSKIETPALIKGGRINEVPPAEVARYLADDCAITALLFRDQVRSQGGASPLNLLDFDTERAVLNMERRGVRLLVGDLAALGVEVAAQITATQSELASLGVNSQVNINSPQQVKRLFESRGVRLPLDRKTGKPSTGKLALETLDRGGDPLAAAVLRARKALKLRDAFLVPLPTFISPRTGLIHASVKTAHTVTGRFSYEGPNLQQIPKQGARCAEECGTCVLCVQAGLAKRFRRCFTSASGRVAGADFSQVEMRVAAALSGDAGLLGIFEKGEDLHTSVAAQVRGKALAAVTPDERFKAKAVNFGILNGMGAGRLAHEIKTTRAEAQRFLDRYLETFGALHEWMEATWRACEADGLAHTLVGRQRLFGRDEETRPGISVVVQGSAADLMRAALVALDRAGAGPILAVHDEIICDGALTNGAEVARIMEDAANALWREVKGSLPVQFKAQPGEGATWGDC